MDGGLPWGADGSGMEDGTAEDGGGEETEKDPLSIFDCGRFPGPIADGVPCDGIDSDGRASAVEWDAAVGAPAFAAAAGLRGGGWEEAGPEHGRQGRRGRVGRGAGAPGARGGARGAVNKCGALLGSMMMSTLFDLRVRTGSAWPGRAPVI
jgi:hypothetical protein